MLRGEGLFGNRIEAWRYGPVIPDLYHATKSYGREPIPLSAIGDAGDIQVSTDVRVFLEEAFSKYGHLDETQRRTTPHP